jgi:hypothetical protein
MHLLTREALQLYLSKLEHGGVLIFNITNRYLRLKPLLGNLAAEAHLACLSRVDARLSKEETDQGRLPSHFLVMARRRADLHELTALPDWKPVFHAPRVPVWTDQFSNILSAM